MGLFSGGLGGLGKVAAIINPAMAIGAVTTAGDSILQSYANRKAAQKANKYAYTAWQLQNEYNTPLEQRQRLEEAGYNPNLWYTNGNTGNAGTLATTGYSAGDWNIGANAIKGLQAYQQMEAQNAQILNTEANTKNMGLQNEALQHNLNIARKLRLPVGQVETYPTRVTNEFANGILGRLADKVEGYVTRDGSLANRFFNSIGDFIFQMNKTQERQRSKKW